MTTRVKLYRAVELSPGKFFPKGAHDLNDTMLKHWMIQGMLKDGTAVIINPPPKASAIAPAGSAKPARTRAAKKTATAPAGSADASPENEQPADPDTGNDENATEENENSGEE